MRKITTLSELRSVISNLELSEKSYVNVELKRSWSQESGKKISMLANSFSSEITFLVIGIEDNGNLSGHRDSWLKKELELMSQHLNQFLDPGMTIFDLHTDKINDSNLIIATIKNPGIVVKWNQKAYWGKGTTLKELLPEEILELNLRLPGLTDITKRRQESLADPAHVRTFCEIGKIEYDQKVLDRFHLTNTKCADLLFCNGVFRIIKFDSNDEIVTNETRRAIVNVISETLFDEVRDYYKSIIVNTQRLTDRMLREALGNSIGHAAYNDNDGEIIIELHYDKLVISNLAYQEYASLANKWFSNAHKSPNPFLMEVLRIIGRVDELGTGKKKLFSECLSNGFRAPFIDITDAGRNKRWSLVVPISEIDQRFKKLRERLMVLYRDSSEKILIAFALVLWRDKRFSEIAKYFDTFEAKIAAEIVADFDGPVWLYEDKDTLVLYRWVEVLIREGKESKGFSDFEEGRLFAHCKGLRMKYYDGEMTSKEFRELAHMSNSSSDRVLCSKMLNKWVSEGKLKRIKKGTFKFVTSTPVETKSQSFEEVLKMFKDKSSDA